MTFEQRLHHQTKWCRLSTAQADAGQTLRLRRGQKPAFDAGDHTLRFIDVAVGHQPAWAFGDPEPHQKNQAGESGTDQKCESPAEIRGDQVWIQQHQRAESGDGGTDPEASIDYEIAPAAYARRNKLLNCG